MEKHEVQRLPISFGSGCTCPTHVHGTADHGKGTSRKSFSLAAAGVLALLPAVLTASTRASASEAPAQPAPAQSAPAHPAPAQSALQSPGAYGFMLGTTQVIALSDGTVPQDLHQLLLRTTPAHTDALLEASFLTNPIELSINEWVFKLGDRVVLVDAGAGQLFGPGAGGKMLHSLETAGFRPDDITDILITHIHPDHTGGLIHGTNMVFRNAVIHVGQPDLTFFLDTANAAKSNYGIDYFHQAIMTMKPYLDAGKIKAFDGRTQILPGLTATLHPGHTPGSAFYELTSGNKTFVFAGDIIHIAEVQFPDPTIAIAYDVNPDAAVAERARALPTFVRDRSLLAVPHMPFPGIGHVRTAGHAFEWVPIGYVNRSPV